jgi:hypothetical protein
MLDLPRSVRFTTWTTAVLRGDATLTEAADAIQGTDEPHTVVHEDDDSDLCRGLERLLERAERVAVALPVPGHALGLPGPPQFNTLALEAGECVLVDLRGGWTGASVDAVGLVPDVVEFGSVLEPGAMVTWHVHPTARPRVVDLGSLAEAERALREAMLTATQALTSLDVARWRDDAADRIAAVRDGGLDRRVVPASTFPRALRVLASAARVRAIVELATQDDGAAINGWQANHRTAALREVDQVARRAMVAAVNVSDPRME